MSTTVTIPALRDALRKLEANVSAEDLWEALRKPQRPAPPVDQARALAHYTALADEAVAHAARQA